MESAVKNCFVKYKAGKTKSQFDVEAEINMYDDIDPNKILRRVNVVRDFKIFKTDDVTVKDGTNRSVSPLVSNQLSLN